MSWKTYIEAKKEEWIGKKVQFQGKIYNVVNVDMNGGIPIDKETKYCESHTNKTTAIEQWKIINGVYIE